MVAGSIAMHSITFLAIRTQKFDATPQILHDRDPNVNPRQSRHNKAIASRHSVWQFLILYFIAVVLLLLLGSAKGTDYLNCCLWLPKNQRGGHENITDIPSLFTFQLGKQWNRWTCGASIALSTFLFSRFISWSLTKRRVAICGELLRTIDQSPTLKLVVKDSKLAKFSMQATKIYVCHHKFKDLPYTKDSGIFDGLSVNIFRFLLANLLSLSGEVQHPDLNF